MSAPAPTPPPRSPRRGMCAAVLALEGIVVGLSTPVMATLTDVPLGVALGIGLGVAAVCLILAGMLRKEWAYAAGWAVQVAAIAMGFVVTAMFFLGVVFALPCGPPPTCSVARSSASARRRTPPTPRGPTAPDLPREPEPAPAPPAARAGRAARRAR